ncbi:hypothetical protein CTA2_9464 [Colletotrichum tanaceti]|uniref:Magnesium transport protein CorA n=1 Tax=Colletotrichum tanaceti TaxID=1306861 RepID=A0A4U6XFM8_9PEZI|nr:hypothetical protein CTA2_9464 [Colletotrichum tanaceti]TKW54253.1 hypothetical protein CTA1_8397 [Colletotrichum tanaceti]
MHFSFPYRAWRSTEQLMVDGRINKSSGKAVRSSRDVTFLRRLAKFDEDQVVTDGIYATNVSCMVTGYDQSRWTGLILLETWYEEAGDDPSPDMVARYENDFQDGMLLDPLCRGKNEAVKSIWSPRPYFIRVLEVRIAQVHREWDFLFSNLQDRMNALVTHHKDCIKRARGPILTRNPATAKHERTVRELDGLENGINDMKELWAELAHDLQETVRCGELFMKTDVLYFRNHDEPSDDASQCFPPLTQIRKTFNNLEQLRQKMQDMQKRCREMAESVAAASKKLRLTKPGPGDHAAKEHSILTWITVTSFPVIITSGLFSCEGIIPFERSWKSFVAVLLVVGVIVGAQVAVTWWLIEGSWPLKSPRRLSGEFEEEPAAPETRRAQDGPAQEGIERAVQRRQTFFTTVVNMFQNRGVRRIIAENT